MTRPTHGGTRAGQVSRYRRLIATRWTRPYRNAGMTSSANIRIDFST
jgi:hypothetical protein